MADEVDSILKQIFPDLPAEVIDSLAHTGKIAEYPDKTVLCHEGSREKVFYIILDGKVGIYKRFGSDWSLLAFKQRGEFFGEMALLLDEPRSANVVTAGPVRVIEIERDTFQTSMLANPTMALALTQLTLRQLSAHQNRLNQMLISANRQSCRSRIFVSYSHENREFVTRLVSDLINTGLELWMDHLHIPPGADWEDAIDQALNECDKMLLILSKDSIASESVKSEWKYYLNTLKRPVVPVRYEDVTIPFRRLASIQYVDFLIQEYGEALAKLVTTLCDREAA